ncbi:MAG: penicillin acylase family protein [Desulfobacter sp.]|nr:penicillin acylase family protein [Desulfobacter sp.]
MNALFLDAFLDGVNHCIATQPLPVEYTLLGFTPAPFTRKDCIAVMGYVAYSFADGIKRDSLYTILEPFLTRADLDLIFPAYTLNNHTTVMNPQGVGKEALAVASTKKSPNILGSVHGKKAHEFTGFTRAYQRLLDQTAKIFPPFTGSNSWVLGPGKTKSGHAILANDPHIGIANPGVWYEAHLSYPGYENYGYHLPLMPFPMLAHNTTKAWAITMFENDDLDLYAETFHPEKKDEVKFKGQWVKIKTLKEEIKVKGENNVILTIRITPHGPVISDFLTGYTGRPVSVSWVYHKLDNPILDVVYGMGKAENMDQFRTALSKLAAPGLNISYIDHSGNIGWWAAGRVPIRAGQVSGKKIHNGGSGAEEWSGYLPFEKNPQMENPENSMIITANNLPTMIPIDPIGVLTGYFRPSDRAARIHELLSKEEKWDMEGLKKIQVQSRDALIVAGFKAGVKELCDRYGTDQSQWTWGSVHTIEFVHAMGRKKPLNRLFNVGPFASPSEFTSVNKLKSKTGSHDYKVASLPSTRRLIDCNDPDNSWSIIPTGNSGNFMSPFYDDQAQMFITGTYRKILYAKEQFSQTPSYELILNPEQAAEK